MCSSIETLDFLLYTPLNVNIINFAFEYLKPGNKVSTVYHLQMTCNVVCEKGFKLLNYKIK